MGLPARLRHRIVVGGCSGAELWGYSAKGMRNVAPYYTAESMLNAAQKEGVAAGYTATDLRVPACPLPAAAD